LREKDSRRSRGHQPRRTWAAISAISAASADAVEELRYRDDKTVDEVDTTQTVRALAGW
jgi:hypothetical protein